MKKEDIIKESKARRAERLQFSKRLTTKVVESKKVYNRNRLKKDLQKETN